MHEKSNDLEFASSVGSDLPPSLIRVTVHIENMVSYRLFIHKFKAFLGPFVTDLRTQIYTFTQIRLSTQKDFNISKKKGASDGLWHLM